ncbi:MAG: hypothetical protein OXQ94_04980 [Gemmatimonadota bacterium]|nr:hypothetical protein [Gemmatimonadota bacterium]
MKTLTTIAALAALAWLPPTSTASPQETRMMTIEEAIAEEATTIEEALEALQREARQLWSPAVRLLRQVTLLGIPVNPLPAAELDAFADRLAAMVLDPTLPEHVRDNAAAVLASAANPASNMRGTPYARAFDLLVRAYEGGYDDALGKIFWSDPERGPAYMRGVLSERSERPPLCRWRYDGDRGWVPIVGGASWSPKDDLPGCDGYNYRRDARPTPWCRAGDLLFRDVVSQARKRTPRDRLLWGAGAPQPVPDGLPEHVEDWHRRCR